MTPDSNWLGSFCRLYSVLLYAYPAEFRREYRRPMEQLFRDRCRDVVRGAGPLKLLRFAAHTVKDWLGTAVRERTASVRKAVGKPAPRSSVTEWAGTLLIYLFATTTLVQAYVIPTGSMEGNLMVGDHMLVDRMAYSDPGPVGRKLLPYREIERGDIIAFLFPEDIRQTYVKRVIGIPGDRIRLENGQVIRNGVRLLEPYTQHIATYPDAYRDNFPAFPPDRSTTPRGRAMFAGHVRNGEVIVPPGTLFALGDNRDNSLDSRYWGFVPREYVVGKPLLVYWSYDAPTADLQEWTVDHVVDVARHFFTKTRWRRMLLVPRSQDAVPAGGGR
jgi:signal peptidase I